PRSRHRRRRAPSVPKRPRSGVGRPPSARSRRQSRGRTPPPASLPRGSPLEERGNPRLAPDGLLYLGKIRLPAPTSGGNLPALAPEGRQPRPTQSSRPVESNTESPPATRSTSRNSTPKSATP